MTSNFCWFNERLDTNTFTSRLKLHSCFTLVFYDWRTDNLHLMNTNICHCTCLEHEVNINRDVSVVLHGGTSYRLFCMCPTVSSVFSLQVLIELESALLDDQPHWYKLQLHDVSSLPLPNASPYLQRRGLQAEHSQANRRLQSESL